MKNILNKIEKINSMTKLYIFCGILILGSIIVTVFKNSVAIDTSLLRNQIVEGISFENAKLDIDNDISTLTVDVINNNKEVFNMKYITITFEDNNHNSEVLIGYIGSNISPDEKKVLTAKIDKDLSNSISATYSIIK